MSFFTLPVVLDLVAKATVILAVTGFATAALRRASASTRHFVWTLGIVSALVAPALTVAMPRWELPIVRIQSAAPVAASAPVAPLHQRQAPALGRTAVETPAAPAASSCCTSWRT
jgi:beta-lactamase regulating signal transducer with metallopeptidase domain